MDEMEFTEAESNTDDLNAVGMYSEYQQCQETTIDGRRDIVSMP